MDTTIFLGILENLCTIKSTTSGRILIDKLFSDFPARYSQIWRWSKNNSALGELILESYWFTKTETWTINGSGKNTLGAKYKHLYIHDTWNGSGKMKNVHDISLDVISTIFEDIFIAPQLVLHLICGINRGLANKASDWIS